MAGEKKSVKVKVGKKRKSVKIDKGSGTTVKRIVTPKKTKRVETKRDGKGNFSRTVTVTKGDKTKTRTTYGSGSAPDPSTLTEDNRLPTPNGRPNISAASRRSSAKKSTGASHAIAANKSVTKRRK